ncbi:hypothetical protein CR970_04190 [Candidatus Saccharibacteria bacterium]|nr:MAG: hypothetical protein CR970_04190 [Candidatus Saccharibacteria bacterium]
MPADQRKPPTSTWAGQRHEALAIMSRVERHRTAESEPAAPGQEPAQPAARPTRSSKKLKRFNDVLSFVVLGLGLYITIMPLLPVVQFWWQQRQGVVIPYSGKLADNSGSETRKQQKPTPQDNRLVIPAIAVDEQIVEGSTIDVIRDDNVWRRPNSSTTPDAGNMVVVGHRFAYSSPYGAFYHLDKVKVGERLALYWEGEEYVYEVSETKIVEPSAIEVENDTPQRQLTLYTCAPIWSAKQRLVIVAKPIGSGD